MTRGRDGGGKARGDGVPGVALVAGVGDDLGQSALALGEQADQDRDGVIAAIDAFLAAWNDNPKPFVWTAKADDIIAKVRRARAARPTVSS